MSRTRLAGFAALVTITATVLLPFAGLAVRDPSEFPAVFTFPPPLRVPTAYPQWSWWWAGAVAAPFVAMGWAWTRALRRRGSASVAARADRPVGSGRAPLVADRVGGHRWPDWGSVALLWTAAWWWLAWTRYPWFAEVQRFTFLPLWLGFICSVSALTVRRTGTCLLTCAPARVVALFATSAVFWWGFEWLNRFVHNWHYLGVQDFGAAAYALHASLSFATVLPAVTAVRELLASFRGLNDVLADGPALRWLGTRAAGLALVFAGIAALAGTGLFPMQTYPALWLAPLALYVGLAVRVRREGFRSGLARGDWREAGGWALAALGCGGFWELWNFHSAAKWIYTVPYVDRWHVFEMPLLGYLGYFGFGLECCVIAEAVLGGEVVTAGPARPATAPAAG